MDNNYHISGCGDHAVTVHFGYSINLATHGKVMALFHHLVAKNMIGVKDVIPAYTTVTVVYDMAAIKSITSKTAHNFIKNEIEKEIPLCSNNTHETKAVIEIPVCYDASFGIDLITIAAQKNISAEEIIRLHTNNIYTVYMLGFLPGFAYMGTVDNVIAAPRLSKPRTNINAGSVGIAGNQTGIYSLDSPGGWNIIGQTPLCMFDASSKESPCLLQPGDKIKFVPISLVQFNALKNS